MALASAEAVVPSQLLYLYERLLFKFSSDGFQDTWNIGSFMVIFIFCTVTLAFTLAIFFNWCCSCCFRVGIPLNKVGVMVLPSSSGTSSLLIEGPDRSTVASQTSPEKRVPDASPVPRQMRLGKMCPGETPSKGNHLCKEAHLKHLTSARMAIPNSFIHHT